MGSGGATKRRSNMGWFVFALALAIPALFPAVHYRLVSVEYAVAFAWASFAVIIVFGFLRLHRTAARVEPQ
jgi:hypothetical protein